MKKSDSLVKRNAQQVMYGTDRAFLIRLTDVDSFVGSGIFTAGSSSFVGSGKFAVGSGSFVTRRRRTGSLERLGIWL